MDQSALRIIDHQLEGVATRSSPHQDERPAGEISLIVVHCISLPESHFGSRFVDGLFMGTLDASEHEDLGDLSRVSGVGACGDRPRRSYGPIRPL